MSRFRSVADVLENERRLHEKNQALRAEVRSLQEALDRCNELCRMQNESLAARSENVDRMRAQIQAVREAAGGLVPVVTGDPRADQMTRVQAAKDADVILRVLDDAIHREGGES